MIGVDFSNYPNVRTWLANVKSLDSWASVSEALDGFAASVKDKAFVSL
jgi:hypothetical protein